MKILVGIDIQPIDEVEASLSNFGSRYRQLLFTDQELTYCGDNSATAMRLAERFAAKEAMFKILDTRKTVPSWRSIEVRCASGGGPEIALHDRAADLARRQGLRDLSVSLSHAGGYAAATIVGTVDSATSEVGA